MDHITRLHYATKIRLGLAAAIGLFLIGFVVVPSVLELVRTRTALSEVQAETADIAADLGSARSEYRALKERYGVRAEDDGRSLATAFPLDANQTEIVRTLEAFGNELAADGTPFLIKSINFGRIAAEKDANYRVMPFKMTVNTTTAKLDQLLAFFERTGRTGGTPSRLLSINEVNIQIDENLNPAAAAALLRGNVDVDLTGYAYAQMEQ